jgi:hypothetical protein
MGLKQWDELQLKFDLKLDEVEDDAAERAITAEEARLISEAARQQMQDRLVGGEKPEWLEDYLRLLEQGWPWRVATYIAWASAPKSGRKPKTLDELATSVLGLRSPRVIYTWRRKYPSIDAVIGMMQSAVLFEHRRDVLEALAEMASRTDYKSHQDRKLFLEMIGDYTPKSQVDVNDLRNGNDLSALSDEELKRWKGEAEISSQMEDDGADDGE